jgi:RNA polymerase sigma factor (sigma-70 family)
MAARPTPLLDYLHRLASQHGSDPAPDAVLLDRFRRDRDEAAFAALVARHGLMVLRLCRRVLGDAQAAEDAFQATFLVLARRASAVRPPEALAAWLHQVAYRVALKARSAGVRRRARETSVPDLTPADPHPDPLAELSARELLTILDEEVQRLPEVYRLPVIHCCLEGRTQEETAALLGWTPGSVKGRLERGRARLHARLAWRGLALTAALGAVEMGQGVASAGVPAPLATATVRTAAGGAISARVALLAEEGVKGMALTKAKLGVVLLLAAGVAVAGTGMLAHEVLAAKQPAAEPPARDANQGQPAGEKPARTDRYGDPLPDGTLVRMGTVRFRHAEGVTCCTFSPDGKTLISGGHDYTLRLWDAATGKELRRFLGHRGAVRNLALSPDGSVLASTGDAWRGQEPGRIFIWDVGTGKERARLLGPEKQAACLAWSPDGKTLAAGGEDGSVRLYVPAEEKEVRRLAWHKGSVQGLAFSPDGARLASAGKDRTVCLGDPAGREEPVRLHGKEKEYHFVAFAPDGKTLLSGGDCYGDDIGQKMPSVNTITVWDPATGRRLRDFRVGDDRDDDSDGSASVTLSPDGKTLALGYWDHTVRLWDVAAGKPLRRLPGYPDRFYPAYHLAFSPDGKTLAAAGSHHTVCLLDTATGKQLLKDAPAQESTIPSVAVSPDGKVLATASEDFTVCLWDAATGQALHDLRGHTGWLYAVAFAPDGRSLASGGSDGTVRVWDPATGKELRQLPADPAATNEREKAKVSRMAFSPDGRLLAAAYTRGDPMRGLQPDGICIWDLATGKEMRRLTGPMVSNGCLSFSPDGRTLITLGEDVRPPGDHHMIRRWRVATGEELPPTELAAGRSVYWKTISPDCTLAATNDYTGPVLVWEVATGRQLLAIPKQGGTGCHPVFSPDGRYLALCGVSYDWPDLSDNLAVELYELASGKMVCRHRLPQRTGVSAAVFFPDGRRLATALMDTTTLIWDLAPAPPEKGKDRPEDLWAALAGDDAPRAWRALRALTAAPESVSFLKEQLRPAVVDRKRILGLVADLDSDEFMVRERAVKELRQFGPEAQPVFRDVLAGKPSAEVRKQLEALRDVSPQPVRPGEELRGIRAAAVLEQVGTPEARRLLEALAKGAPEARLTQQAKASLERLARRPDATP